MNNLRKKFQKFQLALFFAALVFFIFLATILIMFGLIVLLDRFGVSFPMELSKLPFFGLALVSLVIGTSLSLLAGRIPLKAIHTVCEAANKIADGDYSVRIHLCGLEEIKKLSDSFNHMAEELGSVELLRTDFINSFSHEFKTPIVSIRGFAKMLKREDLSSAEREEYLDVIIRESERLSELAANVLALTKLEQQSIVSGKTRVNVSEQLRLSVAVLYSKWETKNLTFDFDCGERYVTGNEELLRQVWINLLDNAAKFSPEGGVISIRIVRRTGFLEVSVQDHGCGMTSETAAHIFDKFYQGDASHTQGGNGLGLAIARRIVQLHGGRIDVCSEPGQGSLFTVVLPSEINSEKFS